MSGHSIERKWGFRDGYRWAITWLHAHAGEMNDPHARAIINTAAFHMGVDGKKALPVFDDVPPPSPVPSTVSGEWQTIETAPKDGTEFVAAYGHQGFVKQLVRWDRVHERWISKGDPLLGFLENATHWFRLPNPAVPRPSPSGQYGELVKRLQDEAQACAESSLEHIHYGDDALIREAVAAILVLEAERNRIQDLCSEHIIGRGDTEEQLRKAQSRCAELEKALEGVREALEPVAELADIYEFHTPDAETAVIHAGLTVGDLRRARAVLASLLASTDQGNTRKDE